MGRTDGLDEAPPCGAQVVFGSWLHVCRNANTMEVHVKTCTFCPQYV